MQTRQLGNSDVRVSTIGFGAWTIGDDWWGHIPDADALRLLSAARDAGISFFDTAPGYGDGRSERLIGQAFAATRHEVAIGTKFGHDLRQAKPKGHQERRHLWDPPDIRDSLEASLQRLGTDVVDFLELHNPKMDAVRRDDIYATLEDLKSEGKIRAYGAALGPRIGWLEEGLELMRSRRIDALQIVYNLLEQDPGRDLLPVARETDVSLLARVPLSSGLLTGRYTRETSFGSNDHRSFRFQESADWLGEGLAKVDQLAFLAEETGLTLAQAGLRFILDQEGVAGILPTFRTVEEIQEYAVAAAAPSLSAAQHQRIAALYAENFGLQPAGV